MKKIVAAITLTALVVAGCKKEGLDGEATFVVKPAHHGTPIVSIAGYRDSVYIKFGVTEIPENPTTDYDAVFVGEIGENHIHVEHPKWGDYSVYCAGYDTTGTPDEGRVSGGVIVKLKRKQKAEEIIVEVPVTE
jgi:hypothetical protein